MDRMDSWLHSFSRAETASLVAAGVGLATLFAYTGGLTGALRRLRSSLAAGHGFNLLITLKFKQEADKETFKGIFEPLAVHCRRHEPSTLSYELIESDKEPLEILIFERYTSKAALTEVHQKSQPFLQFQQQMKDSGMDVEKSGMSYLDSAIGYF